MQLIEEVCAMGMQIKSIPPIPPVTNLIYYSFQLQLSRLCCIKEMYI